MKRFASLSILTLILSAIPIGTAEADCRRAACAVRNVAVVAPVVQTVVATAIIPLFSVGTYPQAPVAPAAYSAGGSELELLRQEMRAFRQELAALRGGPALRAASPLPFLADVARCGKCHAGGAKQGGLDLSAGLKGLTDLQLLGLQMVSRTGKTVAGKDMPPGGVGAVTDDEDKALLEATAAEIAARKAVAGK